MRADDQKRARELRCQGWTLPEIATEVKAGKGQVSVWVRDVEMSPAGLKRVADREASRPGGNRIEMAKLAWSKKRKDIRESYREEGRFAAQKDERLHILGCSLYWGEGTKTRSVLGITNSDMNIVRVFLDFCRVYFNVTTEDMTISISAYTHVHTKEDIVDYWIKSLSVVGIKERKHFFDDYRFATKGVSGKKNRQTAIWNNQRPHK